MRNLGILLKNYFNVYIGSISRKKKTKQYIGGTAVLIGLGALFILMFSSMSVTTISVFLENGEDPIYALYAVSTIGLIFLALIAILKASNNKKSTDYELLISLPIRKSTIVLSKILREFIFDFFALAFTLLPGYVVYYVMVDSADITLVLFGVVMVFLLTMLSNGVSIILKTIIIRITGGFKNAEIFQTIINSIITIGFIGFYYYFMTQMNAGSVEVMEKYTRFYPLKLMISFAYGKSFVSFLILFAASIVPFSISVLLQISNLTYNPKVHKETKKEIIYNKESLTKRLLKKELMTYFKSTTYVVNTIIGAFFILFFAGIIVVFGKARIIEMVELYIGNSAKLISFIDPIIILGATLVSSTVVTTQVSISMEGKYFWILKANPIPEKAIFHSKLALNLLIGGIPSVISSVLISLVVGIVYLPVILILELGMVCYTSINGLMINLKYYKFDWQDESEVIKQGMSTLMALATSLIPAIIILVLYLVLLSGLKYQIIAFSILAIVVVIMDFVYYRILMTKGIKKFKEINN